MGESNRIEQALSTTPPVTAIKALLELGADAAEATLPAEIDSRVASPIDRYAQSGNADDGGPEQQLKGRRLSRTPNMILPDGFSATTGPEFQSVQPDRWAYWNHVKLDFSRPGRPSDNAMISPLRRRRRLQRREHGSKWAIPRL